MDFDHELLQEFAKVTEVKEDKKETICYGTIVEQNNEKYVQIDGSEILTPILYTTSIGDGERVTVMIKNHSAIVTGNITSPSIRRDELDERIRTDIDDTGIIVGKESSETKLHIDNDSVDIQTDDVVYSQFAKDYVQFGNYQIRRSKDGGLVFKVKWSRSDDNG